MREQALLRELSVSAGALVMEQRGIGPGFRGDDDGIFSGRLQENAPARGAGCASGPGRKRRGSSLDVR